MEIVYVNFMGLAGLNSDVDEFSWDAETERCNELLGKWAITWAKNGHPNGVKFLGDRAIARYIDPYDAIPTAKQFYDIGEAMPGLAEGWMSSVDVLLQNEILVVHIPEFGRILIQKSRRTPKDVLGTLAHYDAAILTLADRAIP